MSERKVWIHPAAEPPVLDRLRAVLAALSCVVLVEQAEDVDVVVVAIGPLARADKGLRSALAGAADGRFRVIGVYVTPGDTELPVAVGDTQKGLVSLDPDLLERAICGGETIRQDGSGGVYVPPETERNCGKRRC